MKRYVKVMLMVLSMCLGLSGYAMGLKTHYESYTGNQTVSGEVSYNFGFDIWYENDFSVVNTDSALSLENDSSDLDLGGDTWYLAKLLIEFSSNTPFDASPYITISGWGEADAAGNPVTMITRTINPGMTNSFTYTFQSDLLTTFEEFGWGNVNIATNADYPEANFNIEKVAMQVVTLSPGENPPAPVPEPATMLLLGTGLIGFSAFRKKKE